MRTVEEFRKDGSIKDVHFEFLAPEEEGIEN